MATSQETLNSLFHALENPLVDMFATAANKVVPIFVSHFPDETAWVVDALSISWDNLGLVYMFSPALMVAKALDKIQKFSGTQVILIASQSPSRPWHPILLQLSLRPRIPLPDIQLHQFLPHRWRPVFHPDMRLFHLATLIFPGKP